MNMRQCQQGGHYYDASVHATCPYCQNANAGAAAPLDMGRTMPLQQPQQQMQQQPQPNYNAPVQQNPNDGRTVAIMKEKIGVDPVVGWLVCTEGGDKGRDFRIHADNNFIGRSAKMDISIDGDETVSRENHAILSYDPKDNTFYFSPSEGRSIVRLNDKAIFATEKLAPYDTVEIGKTKLLFIPLCGDKFTWE